MSLAVLADHMASKGRGPDSMLIHMSPREVQGLQALAENHGGSLTINPETGLPEAGFLDKLLPTIIGVGISYFSGGTIDPKTAAMIVGGVETARTGDIGKGISAGLGAYGGANLTSSMTAAGSSAIGADANLLAAQQAAELSGLESMSGAFGGAGATAGADAVGQAASSAVETATPFEKLSRGFDTTVDQFKNSPMQALKANAKNLGYAFGPAILAGASAKENMPKTTTGMIAPHTFDPYSGTYTAAVQYPASPTRAAGGGLMNMDNGGYSPGQLDFTQRSEPVVRMAGGGVVALAGGGDYRSLTKDSSADDIASAYKQFTTASGGDTAANQKAAVDYLTNLGIGQDKIGQAYSTYQASPTYTAYTEDQMGSFLSNPVNKDINLDKAIIDANANPAAVNKYIASMASPFVGSTWDKGGSGTLGIYNDMVNKSISPDEYYAAATANDPKYAGWTKDMINRGYSLTGGALDLSKQIERDKVVADPVFGYDKQWVKFMDDNKYDANDMAQALGLSIKDVTDRYNRVKAAEKKTTVITNTGGTGTGVTTTTPINYNTSGTNAPGGLESVLGLPPGVSGAGITTVNPNGTITTRPDLTLPMSTVRDDYVRGGGNLGYTSPTFASLKAVEDKYPLRGGSKQSYDFLTGKTDYDPVPYTKTGELMKPYSESVLGIPMASSKKMYLFDPATKTYKINPDYAIPTYDKDGKKSLNLTNQDVINYVKSPEYSNDDAFVSWMTANNLSPEQVAAATGMSIADVYKKIKKAKPVETVADTTVTGQNDGGGGGEANGGLMGMARGGMAQQFNLGDYSDGGRLLRGPGDGVSDSIPASIGGKRPARLADGEFVVPARIVSELGNGSTEAGARKLYAMMDRIQKARRGTVGKGRVAKNSRADKHLPA